MFKTQFFSLFLPFQNILADTGISSVNHSNKLLNLEGILRTLNFVVDQAALGPHMWQAFKVGQSHKPELLTSGFLKALGDQHQN